MVMMVVVMMVVMVIVRNTVPYPAPLLKGESLIKAFCDILEPSPN